MRIKKLAAVAAMSVAMMGVGNAAQALIVDAGQELSFVETVLGGLDDAVDRETDELITNEDSPVRDLATDSDSIVAGVAGGLISGDDPVQLDDAEDALCIVFEGGTDCDDDNDDDDGLLGGLLPDIVVDGALEAALNVSAFVGLF